DHLVSGDAEVLEAEGEFFTHGEFGAGDLVEGALDDEPDVRDGVGEARLGEVDAVDGDGAFEGSAVDVGDEAGDRLGEGGFADPGAADDPGDGAFGDLQVDVEELEVVGVGVRVGDVVEVDHRMLITIGVAMAATQRARKNQRVSRWAVESGTGMSVVRFAVEPKARASMAVERSSTSVNMPSTRGLRRGIMRRARRKGLPPTASPRACCASRMLSARSLKAGTSWSVELMMYANLGDIPRSVRALMRVPGWVVSTRRMEASTRAL